MLGMSPEMHKIGNVHKGRTQTDNGKFLNSPEGFCPVVNSLLQILTLEPVGQPNSSIEEEV